MATGLEDEVQRMNFGGPSRVRMQSPQMDNAMSPPSIQNQLPMNNRGGFQPARKVSEQEFELPKGPINVDDQVIPTMKGGSNQNNAPQEYENGQEEDKEAEELTGDRIV